MVGPDLDRERALEERLAREREAHDELAASIDPESLRPQPVQHAILDHAELRPGARVLDLGCGVGDLTMELVARGAVVTALDLSPGMLSIAQARVRRAFPGAKCTFVAGAFERTDLEPEAFDAVVGRYILHHLDLSIAGARLARILAPNGRGVFLENSARNRLLMFARNRLTGRFGIPRFGTEDEMPLRGRDIDLLEAEFGSVELEYPIFEFFVIFDRQVLRFRWKLASTVLRGADQFVYRRFPGLRPYSYRVLVTVRPGDASR